MSGPRYAVYFAPAPESPLWRFGSAVLGYDAASGGEMPPATPPGCDDLDWPALTQEPRRYGFHATLKAPFGLAEGVCEADLTAFAGEVAAGLAPVELAGLRVAALGAFVALIPAGETGPLGELAFGLVERFERFRAPLAAADAARRLKAPLTPRQRRALERFGYPYVGPDFRFHMTLTGSLTPGLIARVQPALAAAHAEAVPAGPVVIDRIVIFRQERREARFRILGGFSLG